MNIFYNKDGIGDTLLIKMKETDHQSRKFERFGHVVRIFDEKENETVGYNIFHASNYGNILGAGVVKMTDEIKQLVTNAFSKNGVQTELTFEDKPTFVVGFVESIEKHPNADRLSICQVNVGKQQLQIVCGAPNVDAGQKVVVALIGAVMPSGLLIEKTTLRGVESSGMICSAEELALPRKENEKGILVLDDSYEVGAPFSE